MAERTKVTGVVIFHDLGDPSALCLTDANCASLIVAIDRISPENPAYLEELLPVTRVLTPRISFISIERPRT